MEREEMIQKLPPGSPMGNEEETEEVSGQEVGAGESDGKSDAYPYGRKNSNLNPERGFFGGAFYHGEVGFAEEVNRGPSERSGGGVSGSGSGPGGVVSWTGRGRGFVKGDAGASGSGGGPGGCLGGSPGGEAWSDLHLKISERVYMGSFVHSHLGFKGRSLENSLEDASKGDLVNVWRDDVKR